MRFPWRSDFEALKEPRQYGMARAALRLPNPNNKAEWNSTHVRFESAQKVWDGFISAGLARQRKALPFEGAKGAVYELTELGIAAVLEEGEDRGDVKASPEEDLVPLAAPVAVSAGEVTTVVTETAPKVAPVEAERAPEAGTIATVVVDAERGAAKLGTEKPEAATEEVFSSQPFDGIADLVQAMKKARERDEPCAPDSQDEWLLEQAAFRAANSEDVPAWAQAVIQALWAEVCNREKWQGPTDDEAAGPQLAKAG